LIIVNLKGGLGNQMFQYATAYCLSVRNNTELVFDLRLMEKYKLNPPPRNPPRDFDLDIFKIEKKIASKKDLFKVLQFPKSYSIRKIISLILDKLNLLNDRSNNNKSKQTQGKQLDEVLVNEIRT